MTATPIPRTFALTLYSDMDLSILDHPPKTRAGVTTRVLPSSERSTAEEYARKEIAAGHGVFVLCPRIDVADEGGDTLIDWEGMRSVKAERARLAAVFPEATIGMLHGRMKANEKERVMEDFRAGELDLVVTTSVVEVGVDVPRATVMIVENAEMFGLAQLHQLRGRVGRGRDPGMCFLLLATTDPLARERVRVVENVESGLALAERDLSFRGPSYLWGEDQSGWPKFRVAELSDVDLVRRTHEAVKNFFSADPTLRRWPTVKRAVERK